MNGRGRDPFIARLRYSINNHVLSSRERAPFLRPEKTRQTFRRSERFFHTSRKHLTYLIHSLFRRPWMPSFSSYSHRFLATISSTKRFHASFVLVPKCSASSCTVHILPSHGFYRPLFFWRGGKFCASTPSFTRPPFCFEQFGIV